jgi:hypothetical protein
MPEPVFAHHRPRGATPGPGAGSTCSRARTGRGARARVDDIRAAAAGRFTPACASTPGVPRRIP